MSLFHKKSELFMKVSCSSKDTTRLIELKRIRDKFVMSYHRDPSPEDYSYAYYRAKGKHLSASCSRKVLEVLKQLGQIE